VETALKITCPNCHQTSYDHYCIEQGWCPVCMRFTTVDRFALVVQLTTLAKELGWFPVQSETDWGSAVLSFRRGGTVPR
jgi:hypothetical protein